MAARALCLHGHFYQPPRQHPWLGVVEPEPSAAPDRDWNTRITRECYAPMATARILDAAARLRAVVNAYEWLSFDFGPTLLSWLAPHAPEVMAALRRADASSRARTGHGNAWAQAYGHPILPLSTPADVRTQVVWGRREFEYRFGRPPAGMWLPEMAVDRTVLQALADAGIALTMLAPHQARRVRPLGADEDGWTVVTPETLDPRRLYKCVLSGGRSIDVVFRHEALSQALSFGTLLHDGTRFAQELLQAVGTGTDAPVLALAADGETFGHHHRFGDMALAFALRELAEEPSVEVTNPAAMRDAAPPTMEVEIVPGTSWSCPHGVERWRADCGCRTDSPADWTQAWRAPLRGAVDWLRDELAVVYETRTEEVLRDSRGARDRYIDCILEPGRTEAFVAAEGAGRLSPAATLQARRGLELARHALLMQTSCGWFFDDLARIEPLQILRHAARAIELADHLGRRLEDGFVGRLEQARSNVTSEGSGADLYRRIARGPTPARVAATGALCTLLNQPARVPGYEVELSAVPQGDTLRADARVTETATGSVATVAVRGERPESGAPWCRVGEATFTLSDLFGVQRERLLEGVGRTASATSRAGRRTALAQVRPVLDQLLAVETPLPPDLALILGYEEAEAIVLGLETRTVPLTALADRAKALRTRGVVFPLRWIAGRMVRVLEERLAALPDSVDEAQALLNLAAAFGVELDLTGAQVRAMVWWQDAPAAQRNVAGVRELCERLHLAVDSPPAR
jgi:alpha-amylase/alpha-mannosidase (GH57 family)